MRNLVKNTYFVMLFHQHIPTNKKAFVDLTLNLEQRNREQMYVMKIMRIV